MRNVLTSLINKIRENLEEAIKHEKYGDAAKYSGFLNGLEFSSRMFDDWLTKYSWVSVNEQLPKENVFVLTLDSNNQVAIYRLVSHGNSPTITHWNMRDVDGMNSPPNNHAITHWMPFPELPK